jgi:hypothetical protein
MVKLFYLLIMVLWKVDVEFEDPRWLDDVEADIKTLGINRWRLKAQDRKEWMVILREDKDKLKGP